MFHIMFIKMVLKWQYQSYKCYKTMHKIKEDNNIKNFGKHWNGTNIIDKGNIMIGLKKQ